MLAKSWLWCCIFHEPLQHVTQEPIANVSVMQQHRTLQQFFACATFSYFSLTAPTTFGKRQCKAQKKTRKEYRVPFFSLIFGLSASQKVYYETWEIWIAQGAAGRESEKSRRWDSSLICLLFCSGLIKVHVTCAWHPRAPLQFSTFAITLFILCQSVMRELIYVAVINWRNCSRLGMRFWPANAASSHLAGDFNARATISFLSLAHTIMNFVTF